MAVMWQCGMSFISTLEVSYALISYYVGRHRYVTGVPLQHPPATPAWSRKRMAQERDPLPATQAQEVCGKSSTASPRATNRQQASSRASSRSYNTTVTPATTTATLAALVCRPFPPPAAPNVTYNMASAAPSLSLLPPVASLSLQRRHYKPPAHLHYLL